MAEPGPDSSLPNDEAQERHELLLTLAERYLEAARALRLVNAGRFRGGEIAYWSMTTAVLAAALATILYVLLKVKGRLP